MARPEYPMFGVDAGGPSAAIVHQDRLVVVGSGVMPDLFAASRTGVWDDYRLGVVQDPENPQEIAPVTDPDPDDTENFVSTPADGFFLQQTSGRGNGFHALLQQEGLFVFGDLGESVVPPGILSGQTAELRENSWFGSERGRTPVIAGGIVVFLQAGGQDLRGISWTEEQRKYLAPSLLSRVGPIFSRGRDLTFRSSTGRDADTVYVVDETGDVAVLSIPIGLPGAWSRWSLRPDPDDAPREGAVRAATAPLGELVFLVEREGVVALETLAPDNAIGDVLEGGRSDVGDFAERDAIVDRVIEFLKTPLAARTEVKVADPTNVQRFRLNEPRDKLRSDALVDVDQPGVAVDIHTGEDLRCETPIRFEFETLPWVEASESGFQRSVRRTRMLDVSLDLQLGVFDRGRRDKEEALQQMELRIVAERGGRDAGRDRGPPRKTSGDTDQIVRCHYGGQRGWRDRIALRFVCNRPLRVAGLSYRVVS